MIKTKEVSVKGIAGLLAVLFVIPVVYYFSRPQGASTTSIPVFAGEEVVVQKAARAMTTVKAERATTVPMPAPKGAVPLPIVPPAVTFKVLPTYPSGALEKGLKGKVLLSVYLGLSGLPEKVEKKISSGIAEFDQAAVAAISQWRFEPARQGAQAISSWFELPVSFKIEP